MVVSALILANLRLRQKDCKSKANLSFRVWLNNFLRPFIKI